MKIGNSMHVGYWGVSTSSLAWYHYYKTQGKVTKSDEELEMREEERGWGKEERG